MQAEQSHYGVRHAVPKPWIHAEYLFELDRPGDPVPEDLSRAAHVIEYDRLHDRLELTIRGERATVKYGILRVTLSWRGTDYEVRIFPLGKVDIRRGKEVVLEGRFTETGLDSSVRSPDIQAMQPVLSIALSMRQKEHYTG